MCLWKGQRETQLLLKKSGGTTEEVADGQVARLLNTKSNLQELFQEAGQLTHLPLLHPPGREHSTALPLEG